MNKSKYIFLYHKRGKMPNAVLLFNNLQNTVKSSEKILREHTSSYKCRKTVDRMCKEKLFGKFEIL